jgi:hypothetical protein
MNLLCIIVKRMLFGRWLAADPLLLYVKRCTLVVT